MPRAPTESAAATRYRRLQELTRGGQMTQVNTAVQQAWSRACGPRPERVLIRQTFVVPGPDTPGHLAPMPRLILSRGIALRFYLLAAFDAQCRPASAIPWQNTRLVTGEHGWTDLIAVDAAYSRQAGRYQRPTRQNRTAVTSRTRQVQAALRTLEDLGEQALAEIPRKANGTTRDYGQFQLMEESGRGPVPTPRRYTLPAARRGTIAIPISFFTRGWIQLLYPSEIAVWLVLRALSSMFPRSHAGSGVFLYGQNRENLFHLHRDSWEDGCRHLEAFGLIRRTVPGGGTVSEPANLLAAFAAQPQPDEDGRIRYEPYHYQFTDDGLNHDASAVILPVIYSQVQAEAALAASE
jgi:hypothetical protein